MANESMHWWIVARREFIERVRSKWFAIVTVLGPVLMVGLIVGPAWLSAKNSSREVKVLVLDKAVEGVGENLRVAIGKLHSNFKVEYASGDQTEESLREKIRTEEINGYLVIPKGVLSGMPVRYRGDNGSDLRLQREIFEIVNFSVRQVRAERSGMSASEALKLQIPVLVDAKHTTGGEDETSATASFILGYSVMFVLYVAILLYGVNVMRSVVVEKTNRVVELIVSAIRPGSLLLGKILGVGAVGLFQLSVWGAAAFLLIQFREPLLGGFDLGASGLEMPSLSVADVGLALLFFLLGYFFYSSLFAAVGAMVNSEQEAQQAQTPLVILLVVPAVCVQLVASNPRGMLAQVLTLIPFTSPVLMPMRFLLDAATPLELVASVSLLVLAGGLSVLVAGRIYRVGILMYGKRPSLRELVGWLSQGR